MGPVKNGRYQLVALLALMAGVLLAVYPLLPVVERAVQYRWDITEGAAELPLSPYRPASLQLVIDGNIPQGPLIETTVRSIEPEFANLGFSVERQGDQLVTRVGEATLAHEIVDGRQIYIIIDGDAMFMGNDPHRGYHLEGDHRPVVDSLTATDDAVQAGTGLSAEIRADTRFDSHPTAVKVVAGILAVVLLAAAVVLLWLTTGRPRGPNAADRRRRLRPEDGVVLVATALGVIAGGGTDDDGFIRLIAGTVHDAGYLGNYVRWNNAPEAPFGWQYQLLAWMGQVSWEPVWLRLIPWLVALAGWLLLRHVLLPRLLPEPGCWPRVVVTATFLLGWLIYGNALRPELYFAVGTALVFWLVLRAVEDRSAVCLVLAFAVVSWTIGTGPTGLWALTPILIAAPQLWRWLRHEGWLGAAVGVLSLAMLGSVFVVMFADQTLGTVSAATAARTDYGPVYSLWQDPLRYLRLVESFATRQVTTYWSVLALAALFALVVPLRRRVPGPAIPGAAMRPVRWLVWVGLLLVPVLALSPTKLPHHFGALILLGPLAAAVVVHALVSRDRSPRVRPWFTGAVIGGMVAFTGLAFHRANTWWKLGTLGHVADVKPAAINGVALWPILVLAGLAIGVLVWWLQRRRPAAAAPVAIALVLAQVLFTGLTFANTATAMLRREAFDTAGRYTLGGGAIDAITGSGCRLERSLAVEQDPAAGALPVEMPEVDVATGLPVWRPGGAGRYDSGWLEVPAAARSGELPIVVGVAGMDAGHRVQVEFDDGTREDLEPNGRVLGTSNFEDIRVAAPAEATRFRVLAESDGPSTAERDLTYGAPAAGPNGQVVEFAALAPRLPQVTPLLDLAEGQTVSTAWNLAFFTPCLRQPVQRQGAVEIADYILSDAHRPGSIAYSAKNGGPFASAIGLRQPVRVPIYAHGDLDEESINELDLIRLEPSDQRRLQPEPATIADTRHNQVWGWRVGPDVAVPGAGDQP